jgi:hypothetical protein
MRRYRTSPLALAATLALALAGLGATGCAKKLPLDPHAWGLATYPEGTRDTLERTPSDLVVWSDVPTLVTEFLSDGTQRVYPAYRTGAGAMQGLIVDYLQAGGYQVFRHEDGGGYRQFADFTLTPSRRWADRVYYGAADRTVVLPPAQLYTFSDGAPPSDSLNGYVGRAVISGFSSAGYPLTNLGEAPDTTVIAPLRYTGLTGKPRALTGPAAPPDSLLEMSWETVPGAARYWVHVYQKGPGIPSGSDEDLGIALPSPIALGRVRDLFVGYFPARKEDGSPLTAYKLGSHVPPGGRVLVYRVLLGLQEVLIRVSAEDARGRLIATTGLAGDRDSTTVGVPGRLIKFPLGATRVTPDSPVPPPP